MREGKVPMPRVPGQADEHARLEAELKQMREDAIYESDQKDKWMRRAAQAEAELAALREAATAVALADSVLYRCAPAQDWERYTRAMVGLRAALDPGADK
jgi:hypothetical protein